MRRASYWVLVVVAALVLVLTPDLRVKAQDADLATYATIDPPGAIYSEANDINSRGEIVGRFYDGAVCDIRNFCQVFDGHNHAFLLRKGEFTTFDPPSSTLTGAIGIGPSGDIVGTYRTADGIFHGFVLSHDQFTTIDFPGGTFTRLQGINPEGDIVGEYRTHSPTGDVRHGFLLSGGEFTSIDFPGALHTSAWRINSAGQIAGRYQSLDRTSHNFLLSAGEFTTIDFPGSSDSLGNPQAGGPAGPPGLNARGDVVSNYCDTEPCNIVTNGNVHAFLASGGDFASFDFPDSFLTVAFGINDRGDIVGGYKDTATTTCTISPTCTQVHGYLRTMR